MRSAHLVTDFANVELLSVVLRRALVKIAQQRAAAACRAELSAALYDYVTGPRFVEDIKAILRAEQDPGSDRPGARGLGAQPEDEGSGMHADRLHAAEMVGEIKGLGAGLCGPTGTELDLGSEESAD
jgi:hypothetical protein